MDGLINVIRSRPIQPVSMIELKNDLFFFLSFPSFHSLRLARLRCQKKSFLLLRRRSRPVTCSIDIDSDRCFSSVLGEIEITMIDLR
jgi:hypothetical protein